MQFKRVGNRIQVLAYDGYDKAKKRARVRMLGAFCAHDLNPDEKLLSKLDAGQRTEINDWLKGEREKHEQNLHELGARLAPQTLSELARYLDDAREKSAITHDQSQAIYAQLDAISKTLRRAGFKRAQPTKNAPNEDKTRVLLELGAPNSAQNLTF